MAENQVVEGYYDEVNERIYLLFNEGIIRSENEDDVFVKTKKSGAKLLLFLFNICHILICHHPTSNVDFRYVNLFQLLDSIRGRIHLTIGEFVKSKRLKTQFPKDVYHGRLGVPRLLFYFATCPRDLRGEKGSNDLVKKDGTVSKHSPIKKLEFSIEDQIFRIFRRVKLVSSSPSPNSLFSLPSSREGFVYVNNKMADNVDPVINQMDRINKMLGIVESDGSSSEDSSEITPYFYEQMVTDYLAKGRNFSRFLKTHIDAVRRKAEGGLELPTPSQWFAAATVMYPLYSGDGNIGDNDEAVSSANGVVRANGFLQNYCAIRHRFSEARCAKALPMSFNAYKEGLQPHYTQDYHNAKLLQAMSVFSVQARGPCSSKYAEMLVEQCNNYWQSGRQMCEELSLTGHHCSNRRHKVHSHQSGDDLDSEKNLPTMPHQSSVSVVSACNCGRRQANRDDPFTLIDANFTFYHQMEEECCGDLEKVIMPIYIEHRPKLPNPKDDEERVEDKDKEVTETVKAVTSAKEVFESESGKEKLQNLVGMSSSAPGFKKQPSTCELVNHMVTKATGPGKMPAFPSWSLTQLGNASVYAHSSGVSQPGFLTNTKNLLPWDIVMKTTEYSVLKAKWPNLAEVASKRPSFHPNCKIADINLTVKVFIGLEYECPRGHRFINSSPGKTKAMTSSITSRMINTDSSLYLECPCKPNIVAQLMRIHVVTPKAPVYIYLNPHVVPCPDGPSFYPGLHEPFKLPVSTYWVMRLPFIYWGPGGSHLPPKEVPDPAYGRLLKGFITSSEEA